MLENIVLISFNQAQFIKKLSNSVADLKKGFAYKKGRVFHSSKTHWKKAMGTKIDLGFCGEIGFSYT